MSILIQVERCIEKYGKKLIGRADIEDAPKRLDKLTHEEARMATAENLKATHAVGESMRAVADKVVAVDSRVAGVDDRVAIVDDRVAGVDDRVAGVGDRVASVDDRVRVVDDRVTEIICGVYIIYNQSLESYLNPESIRRKGSEGSHATDSHRHRSSEGSHATNHR
jgi:hypothetical protein